MKTITPKFDFSKIPDDTMIGLAEATRLIPGRNPGSRINLGTLQRYANPDEGCTAGPVGGPFVKVVLPSIMRCYKRYTCAAAVELWRRTVEEYGRLDSAARPRGRTDKQAGAAHDRAMERLRKRGMAGAGGTRAKAG